MFKKQSPFKIPSLIKQVDQFNLDIMDSLFSNLKEGVYGFESIINDYDIENYVITPPYHRIDYGTETNPPYDTLINSQTNLYFYDVMLMQPSFLPLLLDNGHIWDDLQLLKIPNVEICVQFLFKKSQMDYNKLFIEQYRHYLRGNDRPSYKKSGRFIQSKILNLSSRIIELDLKRSRDENIDHKIVDKGYDFNFRIMIHCKDSRYIKPIENELNMIMRELDYYNQLRLVGIRDKDNYLSNYLNHELVTFKEPQILSETELLSLFVSNLNSSVTVPKPIQTQSTGKGLDLLPRNEQSKKEIDPSIGEGIVAAIRELGLAKNKRLEIVNQIRSATLQKVTMKIPNGVKFSGIEKNYKDMKAILGYESFTIEQGDEPGTVSFMIPMDERDIIYLRDLLESDQYKDYCKHAELPIILGIDTLGEPLIIDLATLPHLIIAGATGGGKSYFLHSIVLTLLITMKPNELKMYIIDPKRVEFPHYKGFPQVGQHVVTDVEQAVMILDTICSEMDERYKLFEETGVRDLKGYNKKFPKKKLPYIVTIVDEMADLMMLSGKEVEGYIVRLSQLARAAGIHIILATQRPEVKVITGIIKSNVESRVAFSVSSGVDSRIILDSMGAEKLTGKGDGLAKTKGQKKELIRFQSPVIALEDEEIVGIVETLKNQINNGKSIDVIEENDDKVNENEQDPKEKLMEIILEHNEFRIKELQQLMNVSINKVNALMIELLSDGFLVRDGRGYKLNDE